MGGLRAVAVWCSLLLLACSSPPPAMQDGGTGLEPAKCKVTVMPASVVADGVATTEVSVQLVDSSENPVGGRRVELDVSGTGNTVSAPVTSSLDGEATFTVSSTVAEAKTVRALVGLGASQLTLPAQPTVTFVPGPPGAPSTFEWLMEPA